MNDVGWSFDLENSRKIFGDENSDYLISLSSFYKSQIIRKTTGKYQHQVIQSDLLIP